MISARRGSTVPSRPSWDSGGDGRRLPDSRQHAPRGASKWSRDGSEPVAAGRERAAEVLATRGRIKLLLADRRQLLVQALASVLGTDPELEVIGTEPDLSDECLRRMRPDVLAVGYPLVLRHGARLRDEIRADLPELKIIVLITSPDEETLAT